VAGDLIQTFRRTLAKITEIQQRIAADQAELTALRGEIDELRRALRLVAQVEADIAELQESRERKRPIRSASTVGHAYRVLRMVGGPMHVDEIIKNISHMAGKPVSKATLVSNLSRYVKAGDTFTRTGANTFGLISYEDDDKKKEIRLVG
jgi:hypothetical protein